MAKSKSTTKSNRTLRQPKFGRKLKRHLKVTRKPLPSAWRLLRDSIFHLFKHWRVFFGITIIYLILTIALVRGFGVANNIPELRSTLEQGAHGGLAMVTSGVMLFTVLLGSVGNATSEIAGAYQTILVVTVSLAFIWALRQTHSDQTDRVYIRDAFYKGEYPLVPFLLVLLVVGIQLLPLILAGNLYGLVFGSSLAAHWYEQYAWGAGLILLALWSIYMVSSSVFGLYIVTLPDVSPMQALRSAKDLVRYRRWLVLRKVLFLPVALLIIVAAIIVPLIFVWSKGVSWVFLFLDMFGLAVIHSYIYSLYRSLL